MTVASKANQHHHTSHEDKAHSCCHTGTHEAEDRLKAIAREAGRETQHLLHAAQGGASTAVKTLEHQIRAKPLQSSLIALGVGLFAGLFLSRK